MSKILVTGAAGFIGFHVSKRLLNEGHTIIGVDNLNNYYDVSLKKDRLKCLKKYACFRFNKIDIADKDSLLTLFKENHFKYIIHLAAQAGVRYSITNPDTYVSSNLIGFYNILEATRQFSVEHVVYASSSSVYGDNRKVPFSTEDRVDHPISLYAATKKSNELIAYTYSHLYDIPITGLRFFTVYGPWGRPDMAIFLFTEAIIAGKPINVFNNGNMFRDFTYIDDIVEGLVRVVQSPPSNKDSLKNNSNNHSCNARVYNIGYGRPVKLLDFVFEIEKGLGLKANKNFRPMQPGDMVQTFADVQDLKAEFGYSPSTPIDSGIKKFLDWYKDYYKVG